MSERDDDKLMTDAAKLTTEIAPERDLWPEIEAAIQSPARRTGMPWYAQAAAAVLLVGASSFVTYELMNEPLPTTPAPGTVVTTSGFDAEFVSFGEELRLAPSFEHARNDLAAQLDIALDELSPEARADVERNLAVIRGAVAEIKQALEDEPDNELLRQLLADTYREELNLMRQVGGLTQRVMSRNDI